MEREAKLGGVWEREKSGWKLWRKEEKQRRGRRRGKQAELTSRRDFDMIQYQVLFKTTIE